MATQAATTIAPQDIRRRPSRATALARIARKKPIGTVSAIMCIMLILVAVGADVITSQDPARVDPIKNPRLLSPSFGHLFGTDNLFRDVFTRIVVGSRISLGVGFSAVFIGTIIGTSLGLISGYFRGWVDLSVSRAMEVVLGVPPLVLAIFFLSIFKTDAGFTLSNFLLLSVSIGIIIAPTTARIVRGSVLSIANLQYIEAAESVGSTSLRIMLRHILPNVVAPIIVIASIQIGNAILAEAALSFLGLGISDAAHPSWGTMLQESRPVWIEAWWLSVIPGAAISFAVLSFNLFGDALRDVLDPRLRQSS